MMRRFWLRAFGQGRTITVVLPSTREGMLMHVLPKMALAALLLGSTLAAPAFAASTGCVPGAKLAQGEGGPKSGGQLAQGEGGPKSGGQLAQGEGGPKSGGQLAQGEGGPKSGGQLAQGEGGPCE
jgi:hypothetical protein